MEISKICLASLGLILLAGLSLGISVNVSSTNVFPEEVFYVSISANGPVDQDFWINWNGEKLKIAIHANYGERFFKNVTLIAPRDPGIYPLEYTGGRINITVTKPVIKFTRFEVSREPKRNSTVILNYEIKDTSYLSAINVSRALTISPEDGYTYPENKVIKDIMNPGDSISEKIPIRIGASAKNAKLWLYISFTVNKEKHRIVKSYDILLDKPRDYWSPTILLGIVLAFVLAYIWARKSRNKPKEKKRESDAFRGFRI